MEFAKPDGITAELVIAGRETTILDRTECTVYVCRSGKLMSGQRNGRSPRSSHFPGKVILNSVQITEQLLYCLTFKRDPSSDTIYHPVWVHNLLDSSTRMCIFASRLLQLSVVWCYRQPSSTSSSCSKRCRTSCQWHITPVLRQPHGLPVRQRIEFKMAVLVDWYARHCHRAQWHYIG